MKSRIAICFVVIALLLKYPAEGHAQTPYPVNFDVVRRSVVFLHRVDISGNVIEAGTGFLLSLPLKSDPKMQYVTLVTARHIADPKWAECMQSNTHLTIVLNKAKYDPAKDATGTVEVPLGEGSWRYPQDDTVDLAVTVVNGAFYSKLDVDNQPVRDTDLPTQDELEKINSGAQILSAGLLLGASGTKRNYPIFKFGNVSSIPDETIPVQCCPSCTQKEMTEWMIAASLVPGNSGSPIVYAPPNYSGGRAFLLGVQSMSFLGSDVAGMAPVRFLESVLEDMNFPDVELPFVKHTKSPAVAQPTAAKPETPAVPGPIPPT